MEYKEREMMMMMMMKDWYTESSQALSYTYRHQSCVNSPRVEFFPDAILGKPLCGQTFEVDAMLSLCD